MGSMGVKQQLQKLAARAVRFVAREWAKETGQSGVTPGSTVRVDALDFVSQLASGKAKAPLNHLFTWNHRWIALLAERNRRTARDVYDFIEENMAGALFVVDQFAVIRSKKAEIMELGGSILDLGVYKGASTRALAAIFPDETIHGFDSFEGLPDDWEHVVKGTFDDVQGHLPDVPGNVRLHQGWFDKTLPAWLGEHGDRPISLLRVDCDVYPSTKTIFSVLAPLLRPGSWIVFDELIGYWGWRNHEYRAFVEFVEDTGAQFEYVAYGLTYTIVKLV
jgi:hypothetical protein